MRIYHEQYEGVSQIEEIADRVIEVIPDGLQSLVTPLANLTKQLYSEKMFAVWEMHKYRLMWTLRKLEPEIEKENGMFIITEQGQLQMKEFSDELMKKIRETIEESPK